MFDRGNQQDWFDARRHPLAPLRRGDRPRRCSSRTACAVRREAIFDIRIFKDRNFGMSSLVIACMGLGMFGGLVLQPILLEGLLGYPIVTTGHPHGAARHRHGDHHDRGRPARRRASMRAGSC